MAKAKTQSRKRIHHSDLELMLTVIDEMNSTSDLLKAVPDVQRLEEFVTGREPEFPKPMLLQPKRDHPVDVMGAADAIVAASAWRIETLAKVLERLLKER